MNATRDWLSVERDDNDPAMLLPQQQNQQTTGDLQPISTASPMPSYSRLPLICCLFFSIGGFLWILVYGNSDCSKLIDHDAIGNCQEENKKSMPLNLVVAFASFLVVLLPVSRILISLYCSRTNTNERRDGNAQLRLP